MFLPVLYIGINILSVENNNWCPMSRDVDKKNKNKSRVLESEFNLNV